MISAASSISASLSPTPKLKRVAERNTSSGTPIARSTGLGSIDPLEHAEPVEHATPAKSSAITSRSPRQPGNETFKVVESASGDLTSGPFNTTGDVTVDNRSQSRARNRAYFAVFSAM